MFRACSNRSAAARYLLASSSPSFVSHSFFLFSYAFFSHCLPSACPAFACVSHKTGASPMARASVLGCLVGAKIVTGFDREGKAWRDFCRRKRPGERGDTEIFFPLIPLPSHWGGGRKHRRRRDGQEVRTKQKALKIKNSNLVKRSVSKFCLLTAKTTTRIFEKKSCHVTCLCYVT